MNSNSDEMGVSTIHMLLSETARRVTICEIATHSGEGTLNSRRIARVLAEESGGNAEDCYAELRHRHLPTLERYGAIMWDKESGQLEEARYTTMLFDCLNEVGESC